MNEGYVPTVEEISYKILGEPGLYQVNMHTSPEERLFFDLDTSFIGNEYMFENLYSYRTLLISYDIYNFIKQM